MENPAQPLPPCVAPRFRRDDVSRALAHHCRPVCDVPSGAHRPVLRHGPRPGRRQRGDGVRGPGHSHRCYSQPPGLQRRPPPPPSPSNCCPERAPWRVGRPGPSPFSCRASPRWPSPGWLGAKIPKHGHGHAPGPRRSRARRRRRPLSLSVLSRPLEHGGAKTCVRASRAAVSAPIGPGLAIAPVQHWQSTAVYVPVVVAITSGYEGKHGIGTETDGANTVVLMGARLYNPATGRFLQMDPLPAGSANAYDYVGQDPLNAGDLSGDCVLGICWSSVGHWVVRQLAKACEVEGGNPVRCGVMAGGIAPNFKDAAQRPAPGWEWRGSGPAGSGQGNWYNPVTDQMLHPDLNHPGPIGPHYDYRGPDTS